jgi:hypothetical protein
VASSAEIEEGILLNFQQAGFGTQDVCCVVLEPELEVLLVPAWDWIAERLSEKRRRGQPSRKQVLAKTVFSDPDAEAHWDEVLGRHPSTTAANLLRRGAGIGPRRTAGDSTPRRHDAKTPRWKKKPEIGGRGTCGREVHDVWPGASA